MLKEVNDYSRVSKSFSCMGQCDRSHRNHKITRFHPILRHLNIMKSDPGRKTHRLNSEVYFKDSVEWRKGNAKRNFQNFFYNNNKKQNFGG